MQRIQISGGTPFFAADALADALFEYVVALADFRRRDVVQLPVLDDDGLTWMRVLLGPGTQISATEVTGALEPADDGTAAELVARAARIRDDHGVAAWFPEGG